MESSTTQEAGPWLAEMVSAIIPAHNEAGHLQSVLVEVDRVLSEYCPHYEIVVVNDHSTDGTGALLTTLLQQFSHLRVADNPGSKGKGSAIIYGCSLAKGDVFVFLDADLDLPPSQLQGFFQLYIDQHPDGVIGSKSHPQSIVNFPQQRKLLSRGYRWLTRALFHLPFADTQTGMKLFRRSSLLPVLPHIRTAGYSYDLELLIRLHRSGCRIVEIPVTVQFSRDRSRIGLHAVWRTFAETMDIWRRMFFTR